MYKRTLGPLFLSTIALTAPAHAAAVWATDLPAALTQAAVEKKAVLLSFTGSDWCPPCALLQSKVLSRPDFITYAQDKFLLVEIDLPQADSLPPAQRKANQALAQEYSIQSFPSLLVLNSAGIVLGGFQSGTDNKKLVTDALDTALALAPAMHAALTQANKRQGEAKAEALMAAYLLPPNDFQECNSLLKEQIMALDTKDHFGFKTAQLYAEEEQAAALFASALKKDITQLHLARLDKEIQQTDKSKFYKIALAWEKFNILLARCYEHDDEANLLAALKALKSNLDDVAKLDSEAKSLMDAAIDEAISDLMSSPDSEGEGESKGEEVSTKPPTLTPAPTGLGN